MRRLRAPSPAQFAVNDKVFALTDGYWGKPDSRGTYAEFVLVKAKWAAPCPEELPLRIAGAVPLVSLTAWQARVMRCACVVAIIIIC
jgi:NADPH:quinone reductase-like Zn-dependent oxidoreductase